METRRRRQERTASESSSATAGRRVCLITGANTGVGLALAKRLAVESPEPLSVIIACRNPSKANDAVTDIEQTIRSAGRETTVDVATLSLDLGSIASVLAAAAEFRERYSRLDLLCLNAGILPVSGFNFSALPTTYEGIKEMLLTGSGLLAQEDSESSDGHRMCFQVNVLGHFILVRELESLLTAPASVPSRIVWTGSSAAVKDQFSFDDPEHKVCKDPYASSKHAVDLLSRALNDRLNPQRVTSYVCCPGLVVSQLTHNILPSCAWSLLYPIISGARVFAHTLSFTPHNGAESIVHACLGPSASLDPFAKHSSRTPAWGALYVDPRALDTPRADADRLYALLEDMYQSHRSK